MTTKDFLAHMSTLGEILKMMPGAPVDDAVLIMALSKQQPGQKIGAVLLGMRVITIDQLDRALDLQQKMRTMRDLEEVAAFFDEIKGAAECARAALFAAIPVSNHGETT